MSRNLSFSVDARTLCVLFSRSDSEWSAIGSGCIFMRRDLVLTAKHVVTDRPVADSPMRVANGLKIGNELALADVSAYWCHPDIDIALLKLSAPGAVYLDVSHPLYPSHFSLNDTLGCGAVGFDKAESSPEAHRWILKAHHVSSFTAVTRNRASSDEFCLEFEAPWIASGYSGGPLLGEGGGVIGVIIQVFEDVRGSDAGRPKGRCRATSIYPAVESFLTPFDQHRGESIRSS